MIPGYRINKVADDVQKKNTFAPYLTEFTQKALQPSEDVRKGAYGRLETSGKAIPGEFANQRAGDHNYTETQLKQVLDYLNNPANGWLKQEDGTYNNPSTGGVYDPNKARSSAFNPVRYFKKRNTYPAYNRHDKEVWVTDQNSTILPEDPTDAEIGRKWYIDMTNQKASDPIHPESSGFPEMVAKPLTRDQLVRYSPPASASHEFNHAYTDDIASAGLIKRYNKYRQRGLIYATDISELVNAASLFQQQLKRNTGSRIVDKNKFWEDFNNAKKNIQDYDPESRRFMQSIEILQNEAPNDPEAAYMLNQIQEVMPLITDSRKHMIPGYTKEAFIKLAADPRPLYSITEINSQIK